MINNTQYSTGGKVNVPLDPPSNFAASAGNAQVTLTWTDPPNKTSQPSGQTIATWSYTRIVRKTGSQPTGPHDGELVVSSSVRDQYATSGFVDDGLTNDTAYYYAAFAYSTDGVASEGAFVTATPIAGTPLAQLAEGTLIKILENGSPVEFYLAKHSYEPGLNGAGRELMVRKDVYGPSAWNSNDNGNAWGESTLLSWLNNSYKGMFGNKVKSMMGTTSYRYTPGYGNWTVTSRADSIFILSLTEMGMSDRDANVEGTALPNATLYNDNQGREYQWTRSPDIDTSIDAMQVYFAPYYDEPYVTNNHCSNNEVYRPCFTLPNTARVDTDLNLIES